MADIFFNDGSTIQQLTESSSTNWSPLISGNNIVWSGGDILEIYFYDGISITQLTDNNHAKCAPRIYEKHIVWNEYPSHKSNQQIFYYDGSTIRRLTEGVAWICADCVTISFEPVIHVYRESNRLI